VTRRERERPRHGRIRAPGALAASVDYGPISNNGFRTAASPESGDAKR